MFGGLTIATVAGVPLGTFLAQHLGWRATFAAVAILGLIDLIGVAALVPHQPPAGQISPRGQLGVFAHRKVWLTLGTTVLSQAALYAAYTYITPLLTSATGFAADLVPALLVVFGVGTFVGRLAGGRLADRALKPTLCSGLAALALILGLFTIAAPHQAAMTVILFGFGIASFVINPALQTQVMNHTEQAPALASAANISAFNLGNALGPWLAA